jgi:hypothetical protein
LYYHLWDHPGNRYLLDELLADAERAQRDDTVFVECLSVPGRGPEMACGRDGFVRDHCDVGSGG